MLRKMPTLLILLLMLLVGAMYWVDLCYYTNPVTGFITRGSVWLRYAVLALPLLMCLLGLRTVGPRAIAVLRVQSRPLGWLFAVAAVLAAAWAFTLLAMALAVWNVFRLLLGLLMLAHAVWLFFASRQMFTQNYPSPTRSVFWGILAALPLALIIVHRILVRPSSLYRVAPLVRAFAGLFLLLWFGMLLRAFYIALPRSRLRWMYLLGVLSFLFCTCLELPLAVFEVMFKGGGYAQMLESLNMAIAGLIAAGICVAIAGQSEGKPEKAETEMLSQ